MSDIKKIYFVYYNELDHQKITQKGYGASEFQFYILAKKLSEINNLQITIFNTSNINKKLDNITYKNFNDVFNKNLTDPEATIIVMRVFKYINNLYFHDPIKIIIWPSDYINSTCNYLGDTDYERVFTINNIKNRNIKIITPSQFSVNNVVSICTEIANTKLTNVSYIYNALYEDYYCEFKNLNLEINKNEIVYASAWYKGIHNVIKLFDALYAKYPEFKLKLMRPNWDTTPAPDRPYIILLNTIDSKEEYSKILKSSLCVITSEWPETFGCVFAEAYYLGVPVIASLKAISGIHEFIDNSHVCDFEDANTFIDLVLKFRENRPVVKLKDECLDKDVIKEWLKIL